MPSVYYHKLWALLEKRGLSQNALAARSGVSGATLARMREGKSVSVSVLARLCATLGCDLGDVATLIPPSDESAASAALLAAEDGALSVALSRYMSDTGLTAYDIALRTALARNTVKSLLRGGRISRASRRKLSALGAPLSAYLTEEVPPGIHPTDRHGETE